MTLNALLINFTVIQRPESWGRAAQHSYPGKCYTEDFETGEHLCLAREGLTTLHFTLNVGKRITVRNQIHYLGRGANARVHEVASVSRRLNSTIDELAAFSDMPPPRQDHISTIQVYAGLETPQSTALNELIGKLPYTARGLVRAEPQAGDHSEPGIGHSRHVAVAALQCKSERPATGEGVEIAVGELCRRTESVQNVQRSETWRISHQRKGDQFLSRAPVELRPNALVCAARILFRRVRRPVDAEMPEVVETDSDRATVLMEHAIKIDPQARHTRSINRLRGAGR
jgi:hypothetical protein